MRSTIEYIHEDRLVVEVEVSLIETDSEGRRTIRSRMSGSWSAHRVCERYVRQVQTACDCCVKPERREIGRLGWLNAPATGQPVPFPGDLCQNARYCLGLWAGIWHLPIHSTVKGERRSVRRRWRSALA